MEAYAMAKEPLRIRPWDINGGRILKEDVTYLLACGGFENEAKAKRNGQAQGPSRIMGS